MALSYIYEYVRKLIKRMRAQKQTVTRMSFLKKASACTHLCIYEKRTSMKNFFNSHFYSQSSKRQYICVAVHKSYCWN